MFQAIPILAIAPVIITIASLTANRLGTFGSHLLATGTISFLISVFPLIVQTTKGLESAGSDALDLFHSLNASPLQIYRKLRIPISIPHFLVGMRTAAALAVVGAIVGEFTTPDMGLGFWIFSRNLYNEYDSALAGAGFGSLASLFLVGVVLGVEFLVKRRLQPK